MSTDLVKLSQPRVNPVVSSQKKGLKQWRFRYVCPDHTRKVKR